MIYILLFALLIFFLYQMSARMDHNIQKECGPHKWESHPQGFMYCKICKFIAGSDNDKLERDDYN